MNHNQILFFFVSLALIMGGATYLHNWRAGAILCGIAVLFIWALLYIAYYRKKELPHGISEEHLRHKIAHGDEEALIDLAVLIITKEGETRAKEGIKLLAAAVELGNSRAMLILGDAHRSGEGVEISVPRALVWYRKAAALGNSEAMFRIARCYENGIGLDKNPEEAQKMYRLAADAGSTYAAWLLAVRRLRKPHLDESEKSEAAHDLALALRKGEPEVLQTVSDFLFRCNLSKRDTAKLLGQLEMLAEKHNRHALCILGRIYFYGRNVKQNLNRAYRYYKYAHDYHSDEGTYWTGVCMLYGMGAPENIRLGIRRLKKLIRKNSDTLAARALGNYYESIGEERLQHAYYLMAERDFPDLAEARIELEKKAYFIPFLHLPLFPADIKLLLILILLITVTLGLILAVLTHSPQNVSPSPFVNINP